MDLRPVDVAAGHDGLLGDGLRVYKPISGRRGDTEGSFYENIQQLSEIDTLKDWLSYFPKFYGIQTIQNNQSSSKFLVLEDLCRGFSKPNVIDLKIGIQTWDEDAPVEKVLKESTKYPLQQKLGFRLTGMRVWDQAKKEFVVYGREFGYNLQENEIRDGLRSYFYNGCSFNFESVTHICRCLLDLQAFFKKQQLWRFYGSSILIITEGDDVPLKKPPVVRMIDFAHVWRILDDGFDDGYLLGLSSVLHFFETLSD